MSLTAVAVLGLLAGLAVGLVIAIVSRRTNESRTNQSRTNQSRTNERSTDQGRHHDEGDA
jgi:hypothetical protein